MPPIAPTTRRYKILGLLGEGGFGSVYRATLETGEGFTREVAVKLLHDRQFSPDVLERFRDEARILGLLRDRGVVSVEPPVRLGERWAVVMEYVEGVTAGWLLERGPLPPRVAVEIIQEIARVLDVAWHHPGPEGGPLHLLHRDLKPANIQISPKGQVKLLDFGIARADFAERESHTTRHIGGTPGYIAPERLDGLEGPAADVWSLGVVLHELVTGERPQGGSWGAATMTLDLDDPTEEEAQQSPLEEAISLAAWLRSPAAQDRPTAREVERAAEDLCRRLPGFSLRDWAEDRVPAGVPQGEDRLVGKVLTETGMTALLPLAAPQRTRSRLALWLGAALLVGLALSPRWLRQEGAPPPPLEEVRLTSNPASNPVYSFAPVGEQGAAWVDSRGVWLQEVPGRPPARVPTPSGLRPTHIDRFAGGDWLVAGRRGAGSEVWRLPREGEPTLLGTWALEHLSLSPGGGQIAYVTADGLYVAELETGETHRVQGWGEGSEPGAAAWSPDGRYLAVASRRQEGATREGVVHLTDLQSDRTDELLVSAELIGAGGGVTPVTWAGEGLLLLTKLEGAAASGQLSLWELRLDGAEVEGERRLAGLRGSVASGLAVRGGELLYTSGDLSQQVLVARVSAAGDALGEPEQLTHDALQERSTGWLPDGRLLITSTRYGTGDVFAADPAGAEPALVLGTLREERGAVAEGGGVLLQQERADGWWVVRAAEGGERPLVRLGGVDEGPWGLRCAAGRCVVQRALGIRASWSLLDPQTGALSEPFFSSSVERWPGFDLSPDGSTLAITSMSARLQLVAVDSGAARTVSFPQDGRAFQEVAWFPDGERVALTGLHQDGDPYNAWIAAVDPPVELGRQVSPFAVGAPQVSADGGTLALTAVMEHRDLWGLRGVLGRP